MIPVSEALSLIKAQVKPLAVTEVELLQSNGRILAGHVVADRDFPPFHRATMDGIAINSSVFDSGKRNFNIEDIQPAGHPQKLLNNTGNCIEVMTGAVLPANTDAVIRYEDISIEGETATVNIEGVTPYQNVHLQAADEKAGQLLVKAGTKITPAIIAVMASVGMVRVKVYQLPRIAVCSTGDELVPITAQPLPHQIRQSNSYMLMAGLQHEGITAGNYHLPDEPQDMAHQLNGITSRYDVLLFSGAVSKGKYDYLPEVLQQLGMKTIFHSIAQKPGKPLLFGKIDGGPLVFGFPGNPVSTWICYQLYFREWLYGSLGIAPVFVKAKLSRDIIFKPALTHHVLVLLSGHDDGTITAQPVNTSTSGDMVSLMHATGFISLPAGQDNFTEGTVFDVQMF